MDGLFLFGIFAVAAVLAFMVTAAIYWGRKPKEKGEFLAVWMIITLVLAILIGGLIGS